MEIKKRYASFRLFVSHLNTDVRKYEKVYSLLPLGLLPYVLLVHSVSNDLMELYGMSSFFIVLFVGCILKGLKNRANKICRDYPTEDLFKLIKNMDPKIKENPFHVIERDDFLAETRGHKILFGRKYLESLKKEEKIFVIGHELFHFRDNGEFYSLVIIVAPIISLLYIIFFLKVNFMAFLPFVVLFGLIYVSTRRSIESMADCQGTRFSNKNAAIKALEKRYMIRKTRIFDFHPRLEIRIRNIMNKCPST